jgi:hypothetical protein
MSQENMSGRLWIFVLALAIVIILTPIILSHWELIQEVWNQWFSNRQLKM